METLIYFSDLNLSKKYAKFLNKRQIDCDIALSRQDAIAKVMLFKYSFVLIDSKLVSNNNQINLLEEITNRASAIVFTDNEITKDEAAYYYQNNVSMITDFAVPIHKIYFKMIELLNLPQNSDFIVLSDISLDKSRRIAMRDNKEIPLRNKEYSLLEFLMDNVGKVLSRDQILDNVWDREAEIFTNTVDVHIHILRKKIDKGFKKKIIKTIPCVGYKLDVC